MAGFSEQKVIKDILNDAQGDQYQVSSRYQGNVNHGIATIMKPGNINTETPQQDKSPHTHTGVKPDLISVNQWAENKKN